MNYFSIVISIRINQMMLLGLFCFMCIGEFLVAQKQDYIWSISHDPRQSASRIAYDFHQNRQETRAFNHREFISNFNTILSDKEGHFKFLSDGMRIYNRDFTVVEGSDPLVEGGYHNHILSAYQTGYRIAQGGIMLPAGINEHRVVLIHQEPVNSLICEMQDCSMQLYYTLVDAEANDGRGRVIQKAIRISEDTLFSGMVSACRHANEQDWWLIVWRQDTNEYICILVNKDGAQIHHKASIGDVLHWKANGNTQSVFSTVGDQYAYFNPRNGLHLYDFDRETGRLGRFRKLAVPFRHALGGCVFSPSSRFLYINDNIRMYQVDTWAETLEEGLFQLEDYDWEWTLLQKPMTLPRPAPYYYGQLAPDCKIYYSSNFTTPFLHMIHAPDEKGEACNFEQRAIKFETYQFASNLPNLPHFRMGEDMERHCALVNQISTRPIHSGTRLAIWPNPASDQLAIRLDPIPPRGQATYTVYSISGKRVLSGIVSNPDNQLIPLHGLPSGIYIIDIRLPDAAPIIERFVKG